MKSNLRERAKRKRDSADAEILKFQSAEVCRKIREFAAFQDFKTIGCYASIGSEVDVWPLILDWFGQDRNVLLPRVTGEQLEFASWSSLRDLKLNHMNILEPQQDAVVSSDIDMLLVPGLVFDKAGNRIGYGKGFYDRYLADFKGVTVGIAFSMQWVDSVPAEAHDVKLKYIATEEGIVSCE